MRKKRITIPAFLEVLQGGNRVFVPSEEYLSNLDFRSQVVDRALVELGRWRDRFGSILDLVVHRESQAVVREVDLLKEKLGRNWPKMPDNLLD